jgi:DNA uptake protein ComE-like DNA-binding protein
MNVERPFVMRFRNILLAYAFVVLATGTAFAQPKPAASGAASTTMQATPPTKTMKPAHPTASTMPAGTKVNLNTATPAQLDALPDIGKARTKEIMTERAKGNFKDWADFDARTAHTSVNKGVKAKIKDLVTF